MNEVLNGIHARLAPYRRWISHFMAATSDSRLRGTCDHTLQKDLKGSGLMQCALGLRLMCPRSYSARSWVNTRMPRCRNNSKATRVMD